MAGKENQVLIKILDYSQLASISGVPDEKFRYLDPEGGYEDPEEV